MFDMNLFKLYCLHTIVTHTNMEYGELLNMQSKRCQLHISAITILKVKKVLDQLNRYLAVVLLQDLPDHELYNSVSIGLMYL